MNPVNLPGVDRITYVCKKCGHRVCSAYPCGCKKRPKRQSDYGARLAVGFAGMEGERMPLFLTQLDDSEFDEFIENGE